MDACNRRQRTTSVYVCRKIFGIDFCSARAARRTFCWGLGGLAGLAGLACLVGVSGLVAPKVLGIMPKVHDASVALAGFGCGFRWQWLALAGFGCSSLALAVACAGFGSGFGRRCLWLWLA